MLYLTIPETEFYDDSKELFVTIPAKALQLEHSLVSMSKWEAKWKVPFLDRNRDKTNEELLDYIRCMTITQNVPDLLYLGLNDELIKEVYDYIGDPMTATWFNDKYEQKNTSNEIVTSEIIYYWMVTWNIPIKCEKWHLNRLMTLIRVCSVKNGPKKKMGRGDILATNKMINEERKKKLNTTG